MGLRGFDGKGIEAISARGSEPGWVVERRLEALARYEALGWPDPASEEWRYTDLKGFDVASFGLPSSEHARVENLDGVPEAALAALGEVGERDGLAIQIDGDVVHRRASGALAAKGIVFCDLAEAAREHGDLFKDLVGGLGVPASEEKFGALGAAIASGGTFVYVPRGVDVALPLHGFRWIGEAGAAVAARTVIVADEASSVTYIDHVASGAGMPALSIGLVEVYARKAANVSYLAVQDHGNGVHHFHVQRAEIGRDATVRSLAATLGGRVSRSVVDMLMNEEGASAEMLGVYFADSDQHFDHRSLQEHAAPNTTSELLYKGALKGQSRAVYSGLIHIAKGARRSDAVQTNRNLVLSDEAKADSIPYLEIENNDVRCAHGASVGPVDDDQLFYLQTRGLDRDEAEHLIVRGYFQEVLDRVRVPEVRSALEDAIEDELALED